MITISSNFDDVIKQVNADFENIDIEAMTREQATTVMGMMRTRVHEEGTAADRSQIGTYSKGYLVFRSGAFKNSGKISKGKNKGKLKNAGSYTKGSSKGSNRTRYNRGSDTKVILSLTRQMESDLAIVPVDNGYGIGYNNSENYNKAIWNEKRYRKEIFAVSEEEMKVVNQIADKYINEAIND